MPSRVSATRPSMRLLLPMKSAANSVVGLAVHLLRRALLLDHAVVEQQDAVRHRHRLVLVVRDDQRRQPHLQDQLAQPGARLLAQLGVEVGQRLVHQDHRRVVDQRARDRDALLLAARELVRQALAELPEAEVGERGVDALRATRRRDTLRSFRP